MIPSTSRHSVFISKGFRRNRSSGLALFPTWASGSELQSTKRPRGSGRSATASCHPGTGAAFSDVTFCRHITIYADIMSQPTAKSGLSALRTSGGEPPSHRGRFGFVSRSSRSPGVRSSTSHKASSRSPSRYRTRPRLRTSR